MFMIHRKVQDKQTELLPWSVSGIELRANKGARERKNKDQDEKEITTKKPPIDKNRLISTEGNTVGVEGGRDL